MNTVTQEMRYRQSLMKYAEKYGVSKASRKYNKSRSYIYFWKARYDGSAGSLVRQSRRPNHHPNQHTDEEIRLRGEPQAPQSEARAKRTLVQSVQAAPGEHVPADEAAGLDSSQACKEEIHTNAL